LQSEGEGEGGGGTAFHWQGLQIGLQNTFLHVRSKQADATGERKANSDPGSRSSSVGTSNSNEKSTSNSNSADFAFHMVKEMAFAPGVPRDRAELQSRSTGGRPWKTSRGGSEAAPDSEQVASGNFTGWKQAWAMAEASGSRLPPREGARPQPTAAGDDSNGLCNADESEAHMLGNCAPCLWHQTVVGCRAGATCHLCHHDHSHRTSNDKKVRQPCRRKRERYKEFQQQVVDMIMSDPDSFDIYEVDPPNCIKENQAMHIKLLDSLFCVWIGARQPGNQVSVAASSDAQVSEEQLRSVIKMSL